MNRERFANGALDLNNIDLEFESTNNTSLDLGASLMSAWPSAFRLKLRGDSDRLIEEWMLAANIAVARSLYAGVQHFSSSHGLDKNPLYTRKFEALLRAHEPIRIDLVHDLARLGKAAQLKVDLLRDETTLGVNIVF
ncbi:unnamed protein product [Protopolystoma xenopodis]|uniref:Uncharacterized protein n=1 Tax=Protopolystoma xenopodis TaxID=117903 RepID=A0A448XMX1_9PLAT|nr:unnamed protein product [Protopolystoma xenopodis]